MKERVQKFGRFLSGMVMPNIGAFIAWGLIAAFFIPDGWFPNDTINGMVGPMLRFLLPILIGYTGGKAVGGQKGAVTGALATLGAIAATESTMFIGAMICGPLGGWCIKKFDKAMEGHIPAGFEMVVNNFSVGIIGAILAILSIYVIAPVCVTLTGWLGAGVQFLVDRSLLPLTAVLVEPAKVLFLNNAINHGVFTPIGTEQAMEMGKSILFMIESNPGPGLGLLLAVLCGLQTAFPLAFFYLRHALAVEDPEPTEFYLFMQRVGSVVAAAAVFGLYLYGLTLQTPL